MSFNGRSFSNDRHDCPQCSVCKAILKSLRTTDCDLPRFSVAARHLLRASMPSQMHSLPKTLNPHGTLGIFRTPAYCCRKRIAPLTFKVSTRKYSLPRLARRPVLSRPPAEYNSLEHVGSSCPAWRDRRDIDGSLCALTNGPARPCRNCEDMSAKAMTAGRDELHAS